MLQVRINNSELNQDVKKKIASRALIIKDNKVAVLYSRKYDAYITPGGGVEENETLELACIREAKEETGIVIKPIEHFAVLDCNYPRIRIVHNYFICKVIEESNDTNKTEHEKDQDLEVRWLSYIEVRNAFSTQTDSYKYDTWMQREYMVVSELRNYLK
jgi:ADP-ribose pyrophosphatase YjhB (NUDIX family)